MYFVEVERADEMLVDIDGGGFLDLGVAELVEHVEGDLVGGMRRDGAEQQYGGDRGSEGVLHGAHDGEVAGGCNSLSGPRRLSERLAAAAGVLRAAGIEQPRLEARLLAGHVLGLDQAALLRARDAEVELSGMAPLLARRAAHEPLALILGRREFWSLDLAVSPATLVPRADSETLIEAALAVRPDRNPVRRVLDLGTGTGCLLLAALSEYPSAWGLGVDRAPAAAALARANAARVGLAERTEFVAGDWAESLAGRFDLVLSNPPYIASKEVPGLMPEVALYEPLAALDGGADGLAAYRHIVAVLGRLLAADGIAVLELGQGQAAAVQALARAAGLVVVAVRDDLGGVARALVLSMAG